MGRLGVCRAMQKLSSMGQGASFVLCLCNIERCSCLDFLRVITNHNHNRDLAEGSVLGRVRQVLGLDYCVQPLRKAEPILDSQIPGRTDLTIP